MEVRPMSADKRWVVLEILGKKKEGIAEEDKGMPLPIRRAKDLPAGRQGKEIPIDTK